MTDSGALGDDFDRFKFSLQTLRALLALCVLVPLLLYVGFGLYRWQQVHQDAETRLGRLLGVAREHALKVLESNEALIGHALSLGVAIGADPAREEMLHRQLKELTAN